jgi:hypothetical protein
MRNALMVMAATIAFAAPVIRSVRIDRPKASASGTLLVDVSDRVMSVATDVLRAWPVMHNTAVLYTRQRRAGELQLRLFDAPSTMSRTVATVPNDVVDLTEESQPDAHTIFILTMRDDSTGNPSLAVVSDVKGVLYREDMAAPGTLANGVLQVRRYTKEEIQRSGGDLLKARPASVDPLALNSVLR